MDGYVPVVSIGTGATRRTAPTAESVVQERIKMRNEDWLAGEITMFGIGSISTLDTSVKTRKKKHPIGFAPPTPKRKVKPRAQRRS